MTITYKENVHLQNLIQEKNEIANIIKDISTGNISPKMTSQKGLGFGKSPFADSIIYFNRKFIETLREMRTLAIKDLGERIEKIDVEISKYVTSEGV